MNEFDDINLPADFDDLSKHAPLLEKIRAKGEGMPHEDSSQWGFVVPEGYFEEALPMIESLSAVSGQQSAVGGKDAGFLVPENYFEELAERIIAIVNISSADNRQPTTDNAPEGYFENLADQILAAAKLSDLKTGESFEV